MPNTLVQIASGDFTDSSTWGVVDATSLVDAEGGITALTTTYASSSTFTPGAITIDRICVKIASRTASPSGTITVALDQGGADVAGTVVTLNVSDIDSCSASGTSPAVATNEGGWYAFKFASPVLLLSATSYSVKAKTSGSSQVYLFYYSSTYNWSRMLVTTTNASPSTNDIIHVMGEHTGQGTGNNFTMTMNNTSSTTFGNVSNTLGAFTVNKRGTVTWGTNGNTNYLLKISGPIILFSGSTWNMGTSGTRIPSTSTATLQFVCSANIDSGLICRNGSTRNCYGNIITTTSTLMTSDKVAGDTIISVASTNGWNVGDSLAFAPTSRTYSQHEKKTILTVDSSTQVTLSAGLTYNHSGTAPTQATVANLTRNVKIIGTSDTLQGYIFNGNTAIVNDSYVEVTNLGSSTTNKRGVEILTTTGSYTAIGCVSHDSIVAGSRGWIISGGATNNISISYCNVYNVSNNGFEVFQATTGTLITIDNCVAIGSVLGNGFRILDCGITVTNCLAAGCGDYGFGVGEGAIMTGILNNWTSHTNAPGGINVISSVLGGTISNLTAWRNSGHGITLPAGQNIYGITIDTATVFGNTTANINIGQFGYYVFKSITSNGDSTFATTYGINSSNFGGSIAIFESCNFGTVGGIKTSHTADVFTSTSGKIILRNCILASSTEVLMTSAPEYSVVVSQKHDQTSGLHKRWERYGTAIIDTTTYRSASPSEKLTPNSATIKFKSSPKQFAVANGTTATVTCYVYKDGSYNGSQPRLIVRSNPAIGITSDTVLATASGGTGSWLTLSGTTATVTDDGVCEIYVDCDGSAGSVYIDDWSVL